MRKVSLLTAPSLLFQSRRAAEFKSVGELILAAGGRRGRSQVMMFLLSELTMTGEDALCWTSKGNREIRVVIWPSEALHALDSGGRGLIKSSDAPSSHARARDALTCT